MFPQVTNALDGRMWVFSLLLLLFQPQTSLLLIPSQGNGKELYDDYVEHELGALQTLRDHLSSAAYGSKTTSESNQGSSLDSPSSSSHTSKGSSAKASSSHSAELADQVGKEVDIELGETIHYANLGQESLHLLCCIEKGRYRIDLHQELITNISDDRSLFRTLRRVYHDQRGRMRPYWSLRSVHSIHFMKV